MKKATQVTAVADDRIQAVIVTAPKDLMNEIAGMMAELDVPSDRGPESYGYHLDNGDPQQVAQVLQNMFWNGNSRATTGSQQQRAPATPRQRGNPMGQTTISGSSGGTAVSAAAPAADGPVF